MNLFSFGRSLAVFIALISFTHGVANAATITSLLGDVHIQPTEWSSGLSIVNDVDSHNGVVYISGSLNGKPAYQSFTVVGGVPVFAPVTVLAVPNAANGEGTAADVAVVNGQVVFGGSGRSNVTTAEVPEGRTHAMTWDSAGNFTDHGLAQPARGSIVIAVGSNGTLAGDFNDDDPAFGNLSGNLQALPQIGLAGTGLAVTEDGKIIVGAQNFGPGVWRATDLSLSSYSLESTTFGLSSFGTGPDFFTEVFSTPGTGDIAFGGFLDLDLFVNRVGAWDLTTGNFLADFGLGELMDAQFFGESLVLAINGLDGGYLTTFDHPDVTVSLASLFPAGMGLTNPSFVKGGLYDGSLGFLASGANGTLATTSFEPAAVPEPSSILLFGAGLMSLFGAKRRKLI